MESNIETLKKMCELRIFSGKVHLFHNTNKLVNKIGEKVNPENVYISKEYLADLSEKMFKDRERIVGFFSGKNQYVRLSFIDEFLKDFNRDIVKEVKEDFAELKKENSEIFSDVKEKLQEVLAGKKELVKEDILLMERYLINWKNLEKRIKAFIPDEFYSMKTKYFYSVLKSYVRFFGRYENIYQETMKFIEKNK